MVAHQLQVERGTGKVRRPETDVYHCATQPTNMLTLTAEISFFILTMYCNLFDITCGEINFTSLSVGIGKVL